MMGPDRPYRRMIRPSSLIWLCLCLAATIGQSDSLTTISSSSSPLPSDEAFTTTTTTTTTTDSQATTTTTTEETSLAASTERTSNAIPEAEQSNSELAKKYNAKKETPSASDQLEKPYPYLKKAVVDKEDKENSIRQTKRSGDSLALNGTLKLSISPKNMNLPEDEITTTTETVSTVEDDLTTTTTPAVTTTLATDETDEQQEEEDTTTQNTQRITESTLFTEKSSEGETETESVTLTTVTQSMPTTLPLSTTTLVSSTTTTSTTPSIGVDDTDVPTTISDVLSTTVQQQSTTTTTTTTTTEEPTTMTTMSTPAESLPPTVGTTAQTTVTTTTTTSTTAEPTIVAASTRIATTKTPTPVTTLTTTATSPSTTTSTTTATTTTAKPQTTVSPKKTVVTTTTSDSFSAITTWQDEIPEGTTQIIISSTPAPEDLTLLVRIVLEGSWQNVCSKLPVLRQSLTDLLNASIEKPISTRQIIFHQTQCSENLTPTSLVTDVQLTSLLVYVVEENGNFDVKLTKLIPSLYEASPIDFPLTIHSVTLVPESDSGNAIAVVIVSCVAFICLILLAGLLFIMRKRQGRFNYGERCRPVSLDAYSLDSVSAYNSVRRSKAVLRSSKRSYGNPAFEDSSVIPTHPLNFAGLSTVCNDTNALAEEFAGIPQIYSKIEELPPGAEIKNRYANVIPLPETRVPLQRINNDPLSEYINASYVRGPKNATKYYIACQAPTDATVADFWRMIWEQQCKVIIMLTDLVENGVDKCTEYIPPLEVSDCHRLYGDYQVTLKKREAKEKYAISTLHLKNLENNTFREVSHIWYLWPASGVPADAAGLIAVLLEARALQRGAAGPILVHCSPGTGRTGTLIALDLCIRQYEITRTVDVPRVVYTIRRDRAGAVQTKEQYIFIYKGLNLYASKLAGGGIDST